ncbi:LysR family transcriptional regulator [Pikeienuella sp. HZG-20]|uniref:LysR family transcriptional regulator n=1 Tax=Paludibacillus litoralis TaxID=3133267 RepID=UPI0030ED6E14
MVREVARCGGFRAAAQKLRLSQSAVSTRIAEAEQRLGVELFDRKRHGARLTPSGRRFLDQAGRLIEMRDQIAASLLPSSGFAGTIRIGVSESIVHSLLPGMLSRVRSAFPDARLELSVELSPVLAKRLVDDGVDVAILVRQLVPAGAVAVPIYSSDLGWFASPRMTLPEGVLSPRELVQFPIVTFLRGSMPFIEVERVFIDPNLPTPLLHGCASLSTMIHLITDGFGLGLLPVSLAQPEVESGRLVRLNTSPNTRIGKLEFAFSYLSARDSRQMERIRECAEAAAYEYGSK